MAHVSLYDRNTREIIVAGEDHVYVESFDADRELKLFHTPYYVNFVTVYNNMTYDTDKHGLLIALMFVRGGADFVNDNPFVFNTIGYERVRSRRGSKRAGTGFDFSEMYYKSPVLPRMTMSIGGNNICARYSDLLAAGRFGLPCLTCPNPAMTLPSMSSNENLAPYPK
ncbi:hypothetical protein Aduo_013247 [Ancylostoma duodenale]